MKKILLLLLISFFSVNSFAYVSTGYICVERDQTDTSMKHNSSDMDDMPCHEEQKKENNRKSDHCNGLCMCLHISQNPTIIVQFSENFQIPSVPSNYLKINDELMSSFIISPPEKPPKATS